MEHLIAFAGLFATALLAATVFSFRSDAVLAGRVLAEHCSAWALVAVASLGNIFGSIVNSVLGRFIARLEHR